MKVLITGGAGFIGSHLADALVAHEQITEVRVLDNLSTGFMHNIEHLLSHPKFEFIKADIRDYDACVDAAKGCKAILHQAALGSVPRSINNPIQTNAVNIDGMLNVIVAAQEVGVERMIYAASSSTYGDSAKLPKIEPEIGKPLSPYAVTKYVNELYADVFSKLYPIKFMGLRYFNVFGPRQNPNGAYAAVIPKFIQLSMASESPVINGDGQNSRDFTYIGNVVNANLQALFTQNSAAFNQVYNIAFGNSTNLNQLFDTIAQLTGYEGRPIYGPARQGDVLHSLADISKAQSLLAYSPTISVQEGLEKTVQWFQTTEQLAV